MPTSQVVVAFLYQVRYWGRCTEGL